MIIFILIILLNFSFAIAEDEIIFFLDLNSNELEIATARKKAKELGKKFVVYPEKSGVFDEVDALEKLSSLKYDTLLISGHNGGGQFSGDINSQKIRLPFSKFQSAIEQNTYAKENTSTLMLLGCNTANHDQILKWKKMFDNLNILAGYDGKSPFGTRESGHSYIKEILEHKDELYLIANTEELKKTISNFKHIWYQASSIYINQVKCIDNQVERTEVLFRSLHKNKLIQFDSPECKDIREVEYPKIEKEFRKYLDGELEPNDKKLSDINIFIRSNNHCFIPDETTSYIGGDQTLAIRFWKEAQHNIVGHYNSEFNSLFATLDLLRNSDLEELKKAKLTDLNEQLKQINFIQDHLKNETYSEKLEQELQKEEMSLLEQENTLYNLKSSKNFILQKLNSGEFPFEIQFELQTIVNFGQNFSPEEYAQKLIRKFNYTFEDATNIANKIESEIINPLKEVNDEIEAINLKLYDSTAKTNSIKHHQSILNDSERRKELIKYLNRSRSQIDDQIKDINKFSLESLKADLNSLPAKTIAQYKEMSRKEMNDFAHTLTGITHEAKAILPSHKYEQLKYLNTELVQKISYNLTDDFIPYSWHEIFEDIPKPEEEDKKSLPFKSFKSITTETENHFDFLNDLTQQSNNSLLASSESANIVLINNVGLGDNNTLFNNSNSLFNTQGPSALNADNPFGI